MIRHLVFFKKKSDVSREQFEAAILGLANLDKEIPEIRLWWLALGPSGERLVEAALISEFDSPEDLETYQTHPAHIQAAGRIGPVATASVFDSDI